MSAFTQALRVRGEEGLVLLLAARPDLAAPPPSSVRSLAARAANRTSLDRALASVDAATLQVLEAVLALDGATAPGAPSPRTGVPLADLAAALGTPPADAGDTVRTALGSALLWTDPPLPDDAWADLPDEVALRPAPGLADVLGPHPAGLGPTLRAALERRSPAALARLAAALGLPADEAATGPVAPSQDATADGAAAPPDRLLGAVVAELSRPAVVDRLLADAPPGARPVLEALTWGPPVGRSPESVPGASSPAGAAVEWALRHGLLAVSDAQHR
ncbi:MAG: hypothetical protein H5T83_03720, partial [Actinotalea sp.]|nr:hypothetical protein [Actinotalea sp.]